MTSRDVRRVTQNGNDIEIEFDGDFCLQKTLECGQCFRWRAKERANGFEGVVGADYLECSQHDSTLILHDTTLDAFERRWKAYFDLERDYHAIHDILRHDSTLSAALDAGGGIRLLNQPSWEALCSYIISQNNNIPRIRGIIERLCDKFGDALPCGRSAFPAPSSIAAASPDDMNGLGAGYRAQYILNAARAVDGGALCLDTLPEACLEDARQELLKLTGVGPKVAECTLLYGFRRIDAFPVDTWIKKAMARFYPNGLPDFVKPYAGIAQIFLFDYIRNLNEE